MQRGSVEVQARKINKKLILNADNDESRRLIETCTLQGKRILNPIVNWTDRDVWEFLNHYGCASNPLYQEGFTRVGCVGCPMAGKKRYMEFERWPKYKDLYIHTFDRMVKKHGYDDGVGGCPDGEAVFTWYMEEIKAIDPDQMTFWAA